MGNDLLRVQDLKKAFGGIEAVNYASFTVREGYIKSLIGPNGAGKTTVLNLISGIYPFESGKIIFKDRSLSNLSPHTITALGIGRTFQNGGLFPNMTLIENVMVGFHSRLKIGFSTSMFRFPRVLAEERHFREQAMKLLESFDLAEKHHLSLAGIPIREQRMVEIASALAIAPALLLLDEPSAGLNETEAHALATLLFKIRDQGATILLVEHNMDLVMKVSDQIAVLNYGEILAEGSPSEIQNDARVIQAYLGE